MQDMHHITPCRFAKLNGRSRRRSRPHWRAVAPGTGQAHRIELRCRSWLLGKRGRPAPKSCSSLVIEVIILTTQRRANFCGDSDTASLRGFPPPALALGLSGLSFSLLAPGLCGSDGRSPLPAGVSPEVKSFIEFLFMRLQIAFQHVPMDPLVIDLRADGGDGDGDCDRDPVKAPCWILPHPSSATAAAPASATNTTISLIQPHDAHA